MNRPTPRVAGGARLMTIGRLVTLAALLVGAAVAVPPAGAAAPRTADGAVIRTWTALAENSVRTANSGDAAAARAYAMVDAAMYDAVNALVPAAKRHAPAIVAPRPSANGDPRVAAAVAAHDVLAALYPQATYPALADGQDAQLAADLADASSPGSAKHGREWGQSVAAGVLAARANDVPSTVESEPGSEAIGEFTGNWVGSQWRELRPFVIADPRSYVQDGRPALDSAAYARAFDEVKYLGDSQRVDPAADATFGFWSLGNGTEQPAGAWLTVAGAVSAQRSLPLAETARLFALESMAMADTVAPTYETKYRFHSWRPVTAIAKADLDPNPATEPADHTWVPRGGGAGSPEHWSGHSSVSAAGAAVLAGFFCTDGISFTLTTSSGQTRSYHSFSAAAAEAGRSRVLGGLHFEFSNRAGLRAGRAIAEEVLGRALLAAHRPTHEGGCPRGIIEWK